MALDEDGVFGAPPRPKSATHVIGQMLDDLSAPELAERIESLKVEIQRLEAAIRARDATRLAASSFFKS